MDPEDIAAYRRMTPQRRLERGLRFIQLARQFKIESVRASSRLERREGAGRSSPVGQGRNEAGRVVSGVAGVYDRREFNSLAFNFDDFDFLRRQFVEFVDQLVDLLVNGVHLTLEICFGMISFHDGELFAQIKHPLDQVNHPVVSRFVRRIGEVNLSNGKPRDVGSFNFRQCFSDFRIQGAVIPIHQLGINYSESKEHWSRSFFWDQHVHVVEAQQLLSIERSDETIARLAHEDLFGRIKICCRPWLCQPIAIS
jgi:hypothetical protein